MKKFLDVLPGYKTYILGVLAVALVLLTQAGVIPVELANTLFPYLAPLMGVTIAMKVDRKTQ